MAETGMDRQRVKEGRTAVLVAAFGALALLPGCRFLNLDLGGSDETAGSVTTDTETPEPKSAPAVASLTPPEPPRLARSADGGTDGVAFGKGMDFVGDVDGDGVVDWAAGDPAFATSSGRVRVFSGKTGSILLERSGSAGGERLGESVWGLGDLNGDGRGDWLVSHRGGITVYGGANPEPLFTVPGDQDKSCLGRAAGPAGDLNGDGAADFVATDPCYGPFVKKLETHPGRIYVFSGRDGSVIRAVEAKDPAEGLGISVDAAEDFNGDGRNDIAAGSKSGGVTVFSGSDFHPLLNESAPDTGLGRTVAYLGDLDGDGHPELAAGTSGTPGVLVFSSKTGKTVLTVNRPEAPYTNVTAAGDVNGDGRPDFALSQPTHGRVLVLSGRDASVIASLSAPDDRFGSRIRGGRDCDGDGRPELLVGADGGEIPDDSGESRLVGKVHLFSLGPDAR